MTRQVGTGPSHCFTSRLVCSLERRQPGILLLFSSHVLSEVEEVCDRVAILRKGRLVHTQSLSDLRQGRLVRARCDGPVEPLPPLEGLRELERTPNRLVLEMTGPLAPLLHWLARQPILDLHIEPLGLTSVYARYHGGDE